MTKEEIIDQINKSFSEHKGTNEAIDDAAFYIAAKFEEYAHQQQKVSGWISPNKQLP